MYDGKGNRKYLNANERKAFIDAALRLNDPKRKAFCLTLFYTGCRLSEALNLTKDQIDLSESLLVFKTLKRRSIQHFRAVPVPEDLTILLHKIGASANGKIWGFSRTTGWRTIKSVMADAQLSGTMASPKGLRHSFAVSYLAADVPLPVIQRWMGHSSLNNTSIYLDIAGLEDRNFARITWTENFKN